jgi:hypothetical protein
MSKIDQAKEVANTVVDKVMDNELANDFIADYIGILTTKQEHINEILKSKGSNYRISSIEVEVDIPLKATYAIEKVSNDTGNG